MPDSFWCFPAKPVVIVLALFGVSACTVYPVQAQHSAFHKGPVIKDFGPVANVASDLAIPADSVFRVAFDVSKQADPGTLNRTMESAARFINMHAEAGVPEDNIHVAVVFHGSASFDVTRQKFYATRNKGQTNASAAAVDVLLQHGVKLYLCGQSAVAHGIGHADLLPGVQMALSAMTAHVMLQQNGYALNPF